MSRPAGFCGNGIELRHALMSKSSKQFLIAFPFEILDAYQSCQNMKNFASFVREATIRRLNGEFGFALDESIGTFRQGERVDLHGDKKQKKLPELQKQAERARAKKASKKKG